MKSNCQTKIYYKTSDIKTLEYIEKLSGKELVTKMAKNGEDFTIRQETEDYLNITTQRALPKSQVAVLLQESLPFPLVFDTQPIPVKEEFDWEIINNFHVDIDVLDLEKGFSVLQDKKIQNKKTEFNEDIEELNI
jgi:type IV secretion system protein VirD4